MDNLLSFTLFGSGILFGILLLLLFITAIVSDINEDGSWATVAVIIFILLNHFWGTFPLSSIFTYKTILLYLIIGFIFSLLRTYFKGKKLSANDKRFFHLKDHVFRWWLMWPISLIRWVIGDLLVDVYDYVYDLLENMYMSVFNAGSKDEVLK